MRKVIIMSSDLITAKTLAHALGMPVDGKRFRSRLRSLIDNGAFAAYNVEHADSPIGRVGSGNTYGYNEAQALAILTCMRASATSQATKGHAVDVERAASLIAAIEDGVLVNDSDDDAYGELDVEGYPVAD